MTDPRLQQKRAAARAAADAVVSGTRLGLGTGSTVAHLLDRLAERIRDERLAVTGVPTSDATAERAAQLGIPLTTLDAVEGLDLTLDGADEVDPRLDLIKGGGGAHTREKIVAAASADFGVIVDASKLVPWLGATFRLPIEIVRFGWRATARRLEGLGLEPELRLRGGAPFCTDNGNLIVDVALRAGTDLPQLENAIDTLPGVVGCGLFLGMARRVWVGDADGSVRVLCRD